jgi:hypothetical protein
MQNVNPSRLFSDLLDQVIIRIRDIYISSGIYRYSARIIKRSNGANAIGRTFH